MPQTQRLDELCEFAPFDGSRADVVFWFVQMIGWLRPRRGESAGLRVKFLTAQLARNEGRRERVKKTLAALVRDSNVQDFAASAGVAADFHFFGAMRAWLATRVLPTPCNTSDVETIVRLAFSEDDVAWLRSSEIVSLVVSLLDPEMREGIVTASSDALLDLVHQVSAQAHAPSVRGLATNKRSPFRGLYDCVAEFRAAPEAAQALGAVRGRINQCVLAVADMRKELAERGADLNTTFLLMRVQQQLGRIVQVADALHGRSDRATSKVFASLVRATLRNASGSHLFGHSSALLVQNLVDGTAQVGRSYLDSSRSTWSKALRAGLGGGVIMAVATVLKFAIARIGLPTFYEGLAFSLNYAAAFCLAYLLHCTIATKLPAHTATALAQCVQGQKSHRARVTEFIAIWRDAVRIQLAGLIGNIIAVVPFALAIDYGFHALFHAHVMAPLKAEHTLSAQSILGPSILFAALTGLFLWISSLLGAAGENWARVARLEESLATNVWAMRTVGPRYARVHAKRFVDRVGGLVGNASLGFMLGGVPAFCAILGLPIEIRHVTVSASSVAVAAYVAHPSALVLVSAIVGVLVIGVVNVVVSFALALWLALRPVAYSAVRSSSRSLIRVGLRRWAGGSA